MKKKSKARKAKTTKIEPRDLTTIVTKIKRTFHDDISNIIGRDELLKAKVDPRDLATIVTKIKRTFNDDISNIIRRGELLQQAKDEIEDGGWLTWLKTNFNWDEETAQRAMSVAKFAAKYDTVSVLNLTKGVLYGLASGGFPDKVVKALLKEATTSGPIKMEKLYEITRKRR